MGSTVIHWAPGTSLVVSVLVTLASVSEASIWQNLVASAHGLQQRVEQEATGISEPDAPTPPEWVMHPFPEWEAERPLWSMKGYEFSIQTLDPIHLEIPFRDLPVTPLLTCELVNSRLLRRFDWWITIEPSMVASDKPYNGRDDAYHANCEGHGFAPVRDVFKKEDPETVWLLPSRITDLLSLAQKHFDPRRKHRMVMISGDEMPLSRAFGRTEHDRLATLRALQRYFSHINVMTKDIALPGVRPAPIGLCWGYFISMIFKWIETASERDAFYHLTVALRHWKVEYKSKWVLAPGSVSATWLDSGSIINRLLAEVNPEWGIFPSNSSPHAVDMAHKSRMELWDWMGYSQYGGFRPTVAAMQIGLERRQIEPHEWWFELAKYRFLLSPTGSAIQASKNIEALIVLTIPIVPHMGFDVHSELVAMGFPMVVVQRWEDITLENATGWYTALSGRLESFRNNCLTNEGYWRMLTGRVSFCQ